MAFAFTACSFATTDGGKDNTSNVTDDDKDNTGEVTDDGNGDVDAGGNEGGNDEGGADGDETTPDEPENPIDPDDPEKPIDPEDPEQPVDPDDPENPVDPVNPDENEPQDITEVDEIDEINKFGDEIKQVFNDRYLNSVVKEIGKTASVDNIVDGSIEWRINANGNNVSSLQVSFYYNKGGVYSLKVANIDANNTSINEIINGNVQASNIKLESMSISVIASNIEANKELGNLVINTVNDTNIETQNEGDIWCSIGNAIASGGKTYRTIKVYQINENQVQKYELIVEATTVNVNEIMQNIKDGKTKGTPTCETMYTFTGIVIE